MKPFRPAHVLALLTAAVLWLAVAPCDAQSPQATQRQPAAQQGQKPYEPEVGQEGKDVVWVPTADTMVQQMLDMAKVSRADYLIDLGSGDGRTVIAAAKRGARAHGIEYNPDMVALAKRNADAAGVAGIATFENADLFETDLSKATVITMFLLPWINAELRPTLLKLKPGTRVVSNTFEMEDWEPDEAVQVTDRCENYCTALLWIVPANAQGTWQLDPGRLRLTQTFQKVSGSLAEWGATTPITAGRLRGDVLTFTALGARYEARVSGDTMEGTVTSGRKKQPFKATRIAPPRNSPVKKGP